MLVRDPSKRASLNEIIESTWVIDGDRGHAEHLPLIFKDHLPECAHSTIVEQVELRIKALSYFQLLDGQRTNWNRGRNLRVGLLNYNTNSVLKSAFRMFIKI